MKKSELKSLIQEVMQEVVWGSTTKKILAGLKGKTITDAVENSDGTVTVSLNDGSKVQFDRYQAYTMPPPQE